MTDLTFQKVRGQLVPCDPDTEAFVSLMAEGEGFACKGNIVRRAKNHRRMFALFRLGFDAWEPTVPEDTVGVVKSFDTFRGDILVLAGHYDTVIETRFPSAPRDANGRFLPRGTEPLAPAVMTTRLVPRSISYAILNDEAKFQKLYREVLAVMWEKVLYWIHYESPDQVDHVVSQLLGFE